MWGVVVFVVVVWIKWDWRVWRGNVCIFGLVGVDGLYVVVGFVFCFFR